MAQPAPAVDADFERIKALKLKDLLAAWNARISEQRAGFADSAKRVRDWDAHLRESMIDLHHLEAGVGDLEQTCELMERNLTEMEGTQANIGSKLKTLEDRMALQLPVNPSTGTNLAPSNTYQGAAQLARAQAYDAAIELGELLDHLETALDDVEERVRAGQMADNMHPVRSGGVFVWGEGGEAAAAPHCSSSLSQPPLPLSRTRALAALVSRSLSPTLPPTLPSPHPQLAQLRQIMYEHLRGMQQVQHGSEDLISQSREVREQLVSLPGGGGGGR
jgi:hypothetical protein